jgi:hypothetical protein
MKCNDCQKMMDQALELDLTSEASQEFQEHLAACPDCKKQYEDMQWILESLGDMPMQPLPHNFKEELHEKLVEAQTQTVQNKQTHKTNWAQKYGKQFSVAAAVVIVLGISTSMLPSLLGGNMKATDMAYGTRTESSANFEVTGMAPADPGMEAPYEDGSMNKSADMAVVAPAEKGVVPAPNLMPETQTTLSKEVLQERKVIQTGSLELEVKNYDATVSAIKAMIQSAGGFVQDLNEYYYMGRDNETQLKAGYITMRIPALQFDSTYDFVKTLGKAVTQSANAQDITNQYRDTVNMKLNLEVREEQLRMIMAKAQRIEDIILVEGELSRVRGEINGLAGTLQQWDSLVDLATITLTMREVEDLTTEIKPIKKDLWTKSVEAFNASMNEMKRNFENLVILLISMTPQLVLSLLMIGLLAIIGRVVYKKIKKGRKIK